VTLGYEPAQKVAIKASVGYVERTYLHAQGGDFSGGVWSATVQWTPSTKAQFALQSWRDLKAYLDAESNHFVSTGESLLAAWLPIAQINLTLQVSHEDQHYIGEELLQFFPDREDKPTTASLQFTYKLRQRAEFNVLYRSEARDSNSFRFDYDAATVSVGGEVKF
jgi:hypothetical protein